ncbi:sugar-binding domain protein [Gardnerella vaginalis 1500E]|uniref:Sugar-binding domain protein n=1 Tax=Gardnerella vaginalis 1500E TaxID=698957 RepID=I4M2F0_GARVA|nr:GA module-containing protein [Gardnerella vaginalis]EIK83390.1 sugar-binding domain protein [Gardnerella vaginalis 1500E]
MKKINEANNFAALVKSAQNAKYAPISKSVCAAMLAGAMVLGGGVFVSTPAYADGYVDGTGNNIYYGYKTDASYSEARFHIEVDYYDTLKNAKAGGATGKDPLGKFVRVHYLSNCNQKDGTADDWRFRPMWWYGVPKGLTNVQNITYTRVEKLTKGGNNPFKPAGSSQFTFTNAQGYGQVSQKTYPTPKDWNGISNFYFEGDNVLASKGWKQLLGLNGGKYDNAGNTESQWNSYKNETAGLQGIFVDWESAGQRFYDMTYVAEMTKEAWEKRDTNPLRFVAGVYRFAGNWHYAAGQKHNTPKIADHLTLKYPDVTLVKNLNSVSTDEQNKIKEKIADVNKDTKHYSELVDKVEVSDKGVATITFKDKTTRTIPANLLVAKNESDRDKYKPNMPARTPVVKPSQLTADDKKAVIEAFQKKNMHNTDFIAHLKEGNDGIKFNDDGTKLVVTYQDGSTLEIPASNLVCQGATIADWAPYVVPDAMEVENLKSLKQDEINKIVSAFDTANQGITPYDEAKAQNGNNVPVTVDASTGAATITWKDGSTTTIEAWQYLKEKAKQTTEPPAPAEAKKEFKVTPTRIFEVNFNPFKTSQQEITTAGANNTQLTNVRNVLAGYAKDAESGSAVSGVTVEYGVDSTGAGTVTFKANGYNDKTYPMSMFFQQKIASQKPAPDTTLHHPGNMTAYQYYVDPVQVDNVNSPSPLDQIAAFKKFMKKNYNVDITDQEATSAYTLKENDKPVSGVTNMQRYVKNQNNGAGVVSFSLNTDGSIAVQGFETGENSSKKLFDVPLKDLYVAKTQTPTDNTFDQLKKQALALWNQKNGTEQLTDRDFKRVGITDPSKYPADINSMTDTPENKTALRKLIQQLYNAKKITRKYNNPADVEVANTSNPTDDDFKKAIKAFLDANYTGAGDVNSTTYTMTSALKPKSSTVDMEPYDATNNPVGITTISKGTGNTLTVTCKDNTTFTVSVTFKKKAAPAPAPSGDELKKLKDDAKQQIDRNPNLTKEQKEQYKKEIGDATTADKIKEILKTAAQQGKNNQNDPSKAQTITENKGGGAAKKEAEDKKQKEEDKHNSDQLNDKKKKASEKIGNLGNLTPEEKDKLKKQINGDNTPQNPDGATTPEEVQKILEKAEAINAAKGALQGDIAKGALPFLDHGTGDKNNTAATHADDAALNELLGGTPGKDQTLTALETALAKKDPAATTEELNNEVAAAKQANALNEQKAKDAANRQLDAKKDALDNAYNALTDEQKNSAKAKYDAAVAAINTAKENVGKATKPSEIKTAVDGVNTSFDEANKAIKDAKGTRDTSGNTNDDNNALDEEKKAQTKRIQDSDLPEADKKKAIEAIDKATKLGDPTGIADRALKAKKIKDALDAIDKLAHLNDAQKQAYKDIINYTDAKTNPDTGKDDIDDALANATATDAAMARLETLKKTADEFANGDKYKNSTDQDKKTAFDNASTAAGAVLAKKTGDAKNADQVNDLYKDLLNAMQAIDDKVKGAGVSTDALQAEVDNDSKFKPTQADPTDPAKPATPGDPIYNTSSQDNKNAFDKALKDAKDALKTAKEDNANQAKPDTTPRTPEQEADAQKVVDEALDKLVKARLALDGVNTKPLQDEIDKDGTVKGSDKYTHASQGKKDAYDKALKDAKDLIDKLTGKTPAAQSEEDLTTKTQAEKQKLVDDALKKLQEAAAALDGSAPAPTPTPTPTPSDVDKTDLAAELSKANTFGRYLSYLISSSDKQDAYIEALAEARRVYGDPDATQDEVNAAAAALRRAAAALRGYVWLDDGTVSPIPSPLPSPLPTPGAGTGDAGSGNAGSGSEAGFGVNDNAPTTVDKGELNVQIDSAEADSQPGNAGNGNAGNSNTGSNNAGAGANSGNAGNANNNAGNGANSAAVDAAVESSPAVKQADAQVAQAQAALDAALAEAKKVAADPNATQAQVDAVAHNLSAARKALAEAKAHAAQVRASVRAQVLKSGGVSQLSKTGSDVSVFGLFATVAAAAFFVGKRRGTSRRSNN